MHGSTIKKAALGIGCALLGTALFSSSASAAVDVTSTADTGAGCSLREAVSSANQNMSVGGCADPTVAWSEIELDAGTYTLAGPVGENSNAGGDLDVAGASLRIVGHGADQTTISGDDKDRVIDVVGLNTDLSLEDVRLLDGNASGIGNPGGGIHSLDGTITIGGSRFESNRATGNGGALRSNGVVNVSMSTFVGNSTAADGGALAISGNNLSSFLGTLLEGNSAGPAAGSDGGAMTLSANATVAVENSTVSGNTAASEGGGIRFGTDAGDGSSLFFATIAGNVASSSGGGLHLSPGLTMGIRNTILAGNTGSAGASNCGGSGAAVGPGYNIESANTCSFPTAPADHNQINTDPQIAPLADNGGPTMTHALYAGSPAIDSIPMAECSLPITDQRDIPRPSAGPCDIGAFEGSIPKPATPGPTDTVPKAAVPTKKCPKGRKLVKRGGKRKCVRKKKGK